MRERGRARVGRWRTGGEWGDRVSRLVAEIYFDWEMVVALLFDMRMLRSETMNYCTSIVVRRHNRRVLEVVVGVGLAGLSSALVLLLGMVW